ncbi:MAG: tRNA (adenosine(37)-N6)-threonylcarbamoyltransferase complex dimerization subunit type 1 TsaB [Flavobacteriaceae bacterium]|nr:tRNA (adenosine(37)-N6)-threonylcarbamoyltransferase complex dimerization subunit type 1 TsaB [Flavobacteriaceae bacterium]
MATILCLETATTNCSVALSVNGSVIAFKEDRSSAYTHAEKLHPFIEDVLSQAGVSKTNLDAVAVSKGPGSYTGLRIGVSAAKGLCFALDIPLISIPTLNSMIVPVTLASDFKIPLLDARRMEVYSSVFNSKNEEVRETRAEILTEGSFSEYLDKGKVIFLGSGSDKFQKIINHPNAIFMPEAIPSSVDMAEIAERKYKKSDIEDVAYFEPYYLKDFISG